MFKQFTLCLAVLIAGQGDAQSPTDAEAEAPRLFSPQAIRADFDQLYAGLREAHADLYAATPQSVMDQRHVEMRAGFDTPMSVPEIAREFQVFTALARHAHARIQTGGEAYQAFRAAGGRVLPLTLSIRSGRVFVETNASTADALQPGDEILSLNDLPNTVWMPRLLRHVSAETPRFGQTILEFQLRPLIWQEWPDLTEVVLDVRHVDGQRSRIEVEFRNSEDMAAALEGRQEPFRLDSRDARMLGGQTAYLRPFAFFNIEPGGDVWDPTDFIRFVDDSFLAFRAAGARHLIIDLRDNPGGDNSFSDPMLAWVADQPFRFSSRFTVRVSPQSTAANQARFDAMAVPSGMTATYAELYDATPAGDLIEIDLPYAQPRPADDRFEGDVYVLVNRYSFSNAVSVAALVQDYGFGEIVGEVTADMATTYGAMETFTLAETGIAVGYPKAHIVRPNGNLVSHPVTPDIRLDFPVVRGRDDVVLDQLIALIQERSGTE
ncbi:S41 family peptidase [Maricaulis sp.]|uniref:S41 family peptidase n=1 Tax=Maricaulis sp. TaxID=1486257 RepID=UPI000C5658EE|nr:S41 family peptidase [Maricaulis sp.]MAC88469.1 hypothetical protein [Maricaulis sp.]